MGAEGFILANPCNARFLKSLTHSAMEAGGWVSQFQRGFPVLPEQAACSSPPVWSQLETDQLK